MCNQDCIKFVVDTLKPEDVKGKVIIEAGARNVNGSVRNIIERFEPTEYVGTDIEAGECVDTICRAEDLEQMFGADSCDMLVTTEMMEHVAPWREIIHNFKAIVKPGGIIYITTRSKGFGYHGYPHDYWRYEVDDMKAIFADCDILHLISDPYEPGVFIKARKPLDFKEVDLTDYNLYAIMPGG